MRHPNEPILVYGASWCPDARRARRLLDELKTAYRWIDIDTNSEARDFVKKINDGQVVIPVIVFPDESIIVEPTNEELSGKITGLL
ncbi:glutaredoxin domain-containing protein [Thermodesulfobacteriota bacterium]